MPGNTCLIKALFREFVICSKKEGFAPDKASVSSIHRPTSCSNQISVLQPIIVYVPTATNSESDEANDKNLSLLPTNVYKTDEIYSHATIVDRVREDVMNKHNDNSHSPHFTLSVSHCTTFSTAMALFDDALFDNQTSLDAPGNSNTFLSEQLTLLSTK